MDELKKQFSEQIIPYQRMIYKACYVYAGDNETLNDLYQDVMLNLWKGFPNFKGQSSLSTWIYRIAINTCISYVRKEKKKPVSCPINQEFGLYEDADQTDILTQLYQRIETCSPVELVEQSLRFKVITKIRWIVGMILLVPIMGLFMYFLKPVLGDEMNYMLIIAAFVGVCIGTFLERTHFRNINQHIKSLQEINETLHPSNQNI